MSTIETAYINAILADASYVSGLIADMTALQLQGKVTERLSSPLAAFLSNNFEIVSAIDTPDNLISGAGFDAVVWRGRLGTSYAGKLYVSMRGTELGVDLLVDGNLAFFGDAAQQTAQMVNWWLRESTPVGQWAAQINWNPLTGAFSSAAGTAGTGRITAADLAGGVEVNGHSLGGYLASVFTRLLGTQANVIQTSTFNSAGIAPNSEPVFSALQALVGPAFGRPSFPGPDNASQLNYFAQHGLNFTTNNFWFSQLGKRVELFNEQSLTQVPNHYMYKLTDSLALARAIELLDPSTTLQSASALFEAGSNLRAGELEGVLDGLRRLLRVPTAASLPVGDEPDSAATRLVFHSELAQLQAGEVFQSLVGRVNIRSSADVSGNARQDFGALAALLTLSPLRISSNGTGDVALTSLWTSARWATEYQQWLDDRTAIAQGVDGNALNFTDAYLRDRASMQGVMLEVNQRNMSPDPSGYASEVGRSPGNFNTRYSDGASGLLLQTYTTGSSPATAPNAFVTFGTGGADNLNGRELADRLFGGAGDDEVSGGSGNDWLEGGAGIDKLIGGAGNDTLLGGANADRLEGGIGGNDQILGGLGDDVLFGDEGDDSVDGGAGNDGIEGGAGNDWLLGGDGQDVLRGNDGNDEIDGGSGDHVLLGGMGSDFLQGGDGADGLFGDAGDDRLEGGAGTDFLNGNDPLDDWPGGPGAWAKEFEAAETILVPSALWFGGAGTNGVSRSRIGRHSQDLGLSSCFHRAVRPELHHA